MTIEHILKLVAAGDMQIAMTAFETHLVIKNLNDAVKQYNPKLHSVHDETVRKDKYIKNEEGDIESTVKVNRLSLALQKKIVLTSAAFLGTPVIDYSAEDPAQERLQEAIEKTFRDNKLDYKFKKIAKTTMSERHCAELWYTLPAEEGYWDDTDIDGQFKLKMRLLCNSSGDELYPVFDQYGDMIAFGRKYKMFEEDASGKEVEIIHFDLYTAQRIYYTKHIDGSWKINEDVDKVEIDKATSQEKVIRVGDKGKGIPNVMGKIPVIYYWQPLTEWDDVQPMIERLETLMSNHADTNDYNGSPIIVAEGEVLGFAQKGESGKFLEAKNGGKVSYLTWDSAPESIKLEMETLFENVFSLTHTPDISFDKLKNLGYFSTIALKTMFLDAHIKASDKEEIFGEGLQRRVNYVKHALAVIDDSLTDAVEMIAKPVFEFFIPTNIQEQLETLTKAMDGGILSKETAIELNPLVSDPEDEKDRIADEKEANMKLVPPAGTAPTPAPTPTPAQQN